MHERVVGVVVDVAELVVMVVDEEVAEVLVVMVVDEEVAEVLVDVLVVAVVDVVTVAVLVVVREKWAFIAAADSVHAFWHKTVTSWEPNPWPHRRQ